MEGLASLAAVVFGNAGCRDRYESVVQPLISLLLQSTAFKPAFRPFKHLAASVISQHIARIFSHSEDNGSLQPASLAKEHAREIVFRRVRPTR